MLITDDKWNLRFLKLAKHISEWSKDSRKVGCVIVRPDKSIASIGFNGFPKYLKDSSDKFKDREYKLSSILHSEINALLFSRERLDGYYIYTWPFLPCSPCASQIIQAGIEYVISTDWIPEKWVKTCNIGLKHFKEAGVFVKRYKTKWVKKDARKR